MSNQTTVLCIHGWGGNPESFTQLRDACTGLLITMLTPYVPGFDTKHPLDRAYTIEDYANWLESEINSIPKDQNIILLGHSHGGRTIVEWLTRNSNNTRVQQVILCAPALLKNSQTIKKFIALILAKVIGSVLSLPLLRLIRPAARTIQYKLWGVHDYEKASKIMQQTMQNVIAGDYANQLPKINIPIDLFWGTEDSLTPYNDALVVHKLLPNSVLHTIPGVRHAVHRHAANQIATTIADLINA
jgi:pimeloyl-ACP methyl ester carboxylesterase